MTLFGLLAMAAWWVGHGGCRGDIVDIDRVEPLAADFQVDINAADWNELIQLPGIGPEYASRILESRRSDGPFISPEDLLRVHGIGPKRLEEIRPYLAPFGPSPNPPR
jgi:competence protein ComEA